MTPTERARLAALEAAATSDTWRRLPFEAVGEIFQLCRSAGEGGRMAETRNSLEAHFEAEVRPFQPYRYASKLERSTKQRNLWKPAQSQLL